MAVRRDTLRLLRQLRVAVGGQADQVVRDLTAAWVNAWNELSTGWQAAVSDVVAASARYGRWPTVWELARIRRFSSAMRATQTSLSTLASLTVTTVASGTTTVVATTAAAEPMLIASQLPAAMQAEAAASYAARILPSALDAIVARAAGQIHSSTRPLSGEASDSVRRALVAGVATGDHPQRVARDMLARVEGGFNGGLARANTIARSEMLDAYRATSQYAHAANEDVLDGWLWSCALATNSCAACWAMHGTVHPLSEPGPLDHPQGRCARLPKAKSWRDLGIPIDDPPDLTPVAQATFNALPEGDQVRILGRRRLDLLRSGVIDWAQLATRRDNPGWRPSYMPTPIRDLEPRQAA